jgi:protein-L-isoaspartate(D-aspartate) O-methyltransferase
LLIDGAVEEIPQALISQLADGARVATGIVERGVTRLYAGRTSGKALGMQSLADLEMVRLPGFERPHSFQF